jgi:hypothetical protein
VLVDMKMLLLRQSAGRGQAKWTARRVRREGRRGYSAATTTTATAREAAQIDRTSLGERELEAG